MSHGWLEVIHPWTSHSGFRWENHPVVRYDSQNKGVQLRLITVKGYNWYNIGNFNHFKLGYYPYTRKLSVYIPLQQLMTGTALPSIFIISFSEVSQCSCYDLPSAQRLFWGVVTSPHWVWSCSQRTKHRFSWMSHHILYLWLTLHSPKAYVCHIVTISIHFR